VTRPSKSDFVMSFEFWFVKAKSGIELITGSSGTRAFRTVETRKATAIPAMVAISAPQVSQRRGLLGESIGVFADARGESEGPGSREKLGYS
jgi:hypothetical protein